ncbi:MAG: hypothetical protein LBD64_04080, partial [Odoribacteraceae bacterium]|jgi:hypothetical protein|nr:hypothetical protein [Odoribacteraceae bacterium]
VTFPLLRDTVTRGVEIISGPSRDSTREKGSSRVLLQETYVLTVFDTGVYMIPAMPIEVEREGYTTVLKTDPVMLIVNTYAVDAEKGYADIVLPKGAPWGFAELWPYVLWGWVALVVVVIIVVLVIRLRSRKSLFFREKHVVPPYVLAIQALDEIRDEKPWQHGRTKEYYTRLTGALRGYMEGELDIPALEQTTREILQLLDGREEVETRERELLEQLLETADLVKFARATPLPDEVLSHLTVAYDFVNHTNERVQQRNAEAREREEKEAEARRAREEKEEA